MMKLLYIVDFFEPHVGGVEKLYSLLTSRLTASGQQVRVITWRYKRDLPSHETINGVEVYRIWAPTRVLFPILALPAMFRFAKQADLIHTSTYSAAFGAWFTAKIKRKKVLLTVHEVWGKLWNALPYLTFFERNTFQLLERILLKCRFDKYIAVSDYTRNCLIDKGIHHNKVKRIYNGIDNPPNQWQQPKGPFTFTFFGRVGASKGLNLFIGAAEQFSENHPDTRFKFIISPQSQRIFNKVAKQITHGKLSRQSILLSELSHQQLQAELLNSHCIVIPSYSEGFGFAAAEVSAMGIPLISSGRGSLPEVVSGQVIEMENQDIKSLETAMNKALENSFETIPSKQFHTSDFVKQHIELYQSML